MPDEDHSQDPPSHPDAQYPAKTPAHSIPEQKSEVADSGEGDPKQKNSEIKKLAKELHWLEKANALGQLILAVVGIAALIIYQGQLTVMQGQLDEMRNNGRDTTDQANRVIANMNWLAKEMHQSVEEARSSIESSKQQTQAAISAAQEQNRPWIQVVNTSPRNDDGGHSLYFSGMPSGAIDIYVVGALTIKNVGHSIAVNTSIRDELFVSAYNVFDVGPAAIKEQRRFCNASLKGDIQATNPPVLVFPDKEYRTDIGERKNSPRKRLANICGVEGETSKRQLLGASITSRMSRLRFTSLDLFTSSPTRRTLAEMTRSIWGRTSRCRTSGCTVLRVQITQSRNNASLSRRNHPSRFRLGESTILLPFLFLRPQQHSPA